jgi:hypothetical protein
MGLVREWHEVLVVFAVVWLCICIGVTVASAQVPSTPEVPTLPPEVAQAFEQAEDTFQPLVIQAQGVAYPALNAVGFALRPACAATWVTVLVVPTVQQNLPISPALLYTGVYGVCGPASSRGPADDVSDQADTAAGRDAYAAAKPVIADVTEALAPARPDASTCATLRLVAPPSYSLPKTIGRVNAVKVVCGR